jgi:hypothetical protein
MAGQVLPAICVPVLVNSTGVFLSVPTALHDNLR